MQKYLCVQAVHGQLRVEGQETEKAMAIRESKLPNGSGHSWPTDFLPQSHVRDQKDFHGFASTQGAIWTS